MNPIRLRVFCWMALAAGIALLLPWSGTGQASGSPEPTTDTAVSGPNRASLPEEPVFSEGRALSEEPVLSGEPVLSEEPVGYVGSEFCSSCHEGYEEKLAGTPHGRSAFGALSNKGCESCHGPGSLHVEDPDVVENQPRLYALSAQAQSAACRTCHDDAAQAFWEGGSHEARGLSCLSCHSVHSFESESGQLLASSSTEQCFSCHQDVRAETWKTSHHPIREGKMSCSDCHDPHGSQSDYMITAASVNDQCYSCHAEKRGPFLWEHPPVRENCASCHTPHGSNHLKLQRTSVPYLCQQCHSNTRHPGTLYDRTTLADGSRPSNRDFSRSCLNCHATIHGSNHPSSPYLAH